MAPKSEATVYAVLPPEPDEDTQNYVVLPVYTNSLRRRCLRHLRRGVLVSLCLLALSLSIFLLWPCDPNLQLVRVKLNHIQVHSSPLSLDLSLCLTLRVRNRDFYSLNYDSLSVSIGYRGKELGFVDSSGGNVKARGSSYVNVTLMLDGFQVLHDLIYLIEDVAAGSVPFDTVSKVEGQLGLLFFSIPIQAIVSCEIYVNPKNQTIIRQNCYPE